MKIPDAVRVVCADDDADIRSWRFYSKVNFVCLIFSLWCIFMCPFKDPSVENTLVAIIWFSSIKVLLESRRANKIMYGLLVTFLKVQGHFLEPLRQKLTRHHAMWGPSGNRTQLVKSINKWGGDHFGNYHWLLLRRHTLTGDVFLSGNILPTLYKLPI